MKKQLDLPLLSHRRVLADHKYRYASWRSQKGSTRPSVIMAGTVLSLLLMVFALYAYRTHPSEETSSCNVTAGPKTVRSTHSTDTLNPAGSKEKRDLFAVLQKAMQVERVHYSGDPKRLERAKTRKIFSKMEQLVEKLRAQGLEGDDLYAAATAQLIEKYGPQAVKILDGYRLLEQELADADMDAMSPEERFESTYNARRVAFGEELAGMLFFSGEARMRHRFHERDIREDSALSEETKEEQIQVLRKKLRVDLASHGTTIRFADERRQALEEKLRKRYGESLESMTPEARDQAIWDMYSEELPPEVMEKIAKIKSGWAGRMNLEENPEE